MPTDIRLILDTSAIIEYAAGSIGLGETIVEVVDEDAHFAVPVLCLIEARQRLGRNPNLDLLLAHQHCEILPVLADDWRLLTDLTCLVGHPGRATGLFEAINFDAYVITAEPGSYSPAGTDLPVIAL